MLLIRLLLATVASSAECFTATASQTTDNEEPTLVKEHSQGRKDDNDLYNRLKEKLATLDFSEDQLVNVTSGTFPKWVDEWVAPKEVRNWFPFYVTGYDEDGSPVYVIEYGRWNHKEALAKGPGGRENMRKMLIQYMQQAVYRAISDGRDRDNQGLGCIFDWEGFSLAKYTDTFAIEMGLRQFALLNNLYHVLKYAFVINTNYAAENFLAIAKPFIGNILEKSEIYGAQKSKWLPHILRKIPKSELAPWYGGAEDWRPVWIGGSPKLNRTRS